MCTLKPQAGLQHQLPGQEQFGLLSAPHTQEPTQHLGLMPEQHHQPIHPQPHLQAQQQDQAGVSTAQDPQFGFQAAPTQQQGAALSQGGSTVLTGARQPHQDFGLQAAAQLPQQQQQQQQQQYVVQAVPQGPSSGAYQAAATPTQHPPQHQQFGLESVPTQQQPQQQQQYGLGLGNMHPAPPPSQQPHQMQQPPETRGLMPLPSFRPMASTQPVAPTNRQQHELPTSVLQYQQQQQLQQLQLQQQQQQQQQQPLGLMQTQTYAPQWLEQQRQQQLGSMLNLHAGEAVG